MAGPIKGAPNWQDNAIELILDLEPSLFIASPRWEVSDKISKYVIKGDNEYFHRARAWERYYFDLALEKGCVMFWLPTEQQHKCDKVYWAMTGFELGIINARYGVDKSLRFCIGTDGGFSEFRTIQYDLSIDAPGKLIFSNLEDTCREAISLVDG